MAAALRQVQDIPRNASSVPGSIRSVSRQAQGLSAKQATSFVRWSPRASISGHGLVASPCAPAVHSTSERRRDFVRELAGNGALPFNGETAMVTRQQEHRADARSAIPPGPEGPGFSRRNGDLETGPKRSGLRNLIFQRLGNRESERHG